MLRREFLGSVVATTLTANVSNVATSFSVVDGSTFPTGSSGNMFVVVLSRGTPVEEKMLISSRSTNTFNIYQRGYDGTTAQNHTAPSSVDHVLDALTIQDMNRSTYDNEISIWMAV